MNDSWSGAIYATAAYAFWGLTPLYWKAVEEVPPGELLGHRIPLAVYSRDAFRIPGASPAGSTR